MRLYLKGNYTQKFVYSLYTYKLYIDVLTKDHKQHLKKEKVVLFSYHIENLITA